MLAEEGRSIGGYLTPEFLGTYAAAVHVDLQHSLSLVQYEALPHKAARDKLKIFRPKQQVERFINLRANMQNLIFSTYEWNREVNKLPKVVKPTCFNKIKHADPVTFEETSA